MGQIFRRQGRQQIQIAQNTLGFGDDGNRVLIVVQHSENIPRHTQFFFRRLIRIRINAEGDGRALMPWFPKLFLQKRSTDGFEEILGFKIQGGRQTQITMSRPGKTINTSISAVLIGIYGAIKGNVGRRVAGQDFSGGIRFQVRHPLPGQLLLLPSAVICSQAVPGHRTDRKHLPRPLRGWSGGVFNIVQGHP